MGAIARLREQTKQLVVLDGGDNFFDTPEQAQAKDAMTRAEVTATSSAAPRAPATPSPPPTGSAR